MSLPFAILCDTERQVVKAWDVYNSREKGGIAKPAVFIIGSALTAHFASLDTVAVRVPASEIVRILRYPARGACSPPSTFQPLPISFKVAEVHVSICGRYALGA